MKHQTIARRAALALASLAATSAAASAAATVNFSSTAGATNLQSDGTPLDPSFKFQIGTFVPGFTPTADNTDGWLAHWVPLGDAAGDPLSGATVHYTQTFLPSPPFPEGASTYGFSGSAEYDHNEPPFTTDAGVYIWGYNNRQQPGPAEWLLVTDSNWLWPAGTANPPATTYSISAAGEVMLGEVDGDGFHIRTAAVTVPQDLSTPSYDSWLAAHFDGADLAQPELADTLWGALADPDGDGIANVIEYYSGSDPNDSSSGRTTSATAAADGTLAFTFYEAKDSAGAVGTVEWTTDLVHWQTAGVTTKVVEDLGDVLRVEATVPGAAGETFARLNVRRSFE